MSDDFMDVDSARYMEGPPGLVLDTKRLEDIVRLKVSIWAELYPAHAAMVKRLPTKPTALPRVIETPEIGTFLEIYAEVEDGEIVCGQIPLEDVLA
jgi:hypothetical protein